MHQVLAAACTNCCHRLHEVTAVGNSTCQVLAAGSNTRQVLAVAPTKCCHQLHEVMAVGSGMSQVLTVGSNTRQVQAPVTASNGRISQMLSPIAHGDGNWWWHVPSVGSGMHQVLSSVA